jgi:signal transduction histidine kinase/DNA-binding response OmpR family regulator
MVGEEAEWSDWTLRTEQTYRNLGPGPHEFVVRARTAYGDTTRTARYAFTVLPPWYRTWGAYALYALLALGLIAGVVQWRTRQLRRRQEELETAVEERTREIETQKEQLADQAERLQELDEAKTRFFANVSHEFRTPLTLILGPVQDLRAWARQTPSDAPVEHLSVIERNAHRLLRLVDQLLGIARMDAGTYRLDARPTDLQDEVERIARTYEPLAERSDLSLTVATISENREEETDAPVYVDREALEHIVGNLLSNAIKFTPEGGTITVTVAEHPDTVEVSVADTGPGIPKDQRDAVFDRFEQSHDAAGNGTHTQKGAGIGLAFVRDLVDLHEGSIELESTEGEGTRVSVRFIRGADHLSDAHLADSSPSPDQSRDESRAVPDDEQTPPPAQEVASSEPSSPDLETIPDSTNGTPSPPFEAHGRKKRVLIVEDNTDVQRYVRSILEPEFDVLTAPNGADGLAVAREELPDVILADVMMPTMGGHEMTRRLKKTPETAPIPIIMVTARAGTGDEVEGLQAGADDYITKPFDATVLQQRVGGVIAFQERLRKRLRAQLKAESSSKDHNESDQCSEFERRARSVIHEHLTDPDFDVETLAAEMAMSRSTLYRTFKDETDTTPSALITEVRMERAKTLLQNEEGTVTQIAYAVGFDQLSSFSRTFREYTGHPPSTVIAATGTA